MAEDNPVVVEPIGTPATTEPPAQLPTTEGQPIAAPQPATAPEQDQSAAFFQKRWQDSMEFLRVNDPAAYYKVMAAQKGTQPVVQTPVQPEPEPEIGSYGDLRRELIKDIETISRKTLEQGRYEAAIQEEQRTVRGHMLKVAADYGMTTQELASVMVEVEADYGWDEHQLGSATKIAKATLERLHNRQLLSHLTGRVTKAEVEAAGKVKAAALAAQPTPGALPGQTTKTREEELLEGMNKIAPRPASEMFSK